MTTINEQGQPISEEQIVALENVVGVKLPATYRQFLILNNGGRPKPDVVDVVGLPGTPTDIQIFFGIGRQFKTSELLWNLALIADCCSGHHLLPIACDSGGNLFCFRILNGIALDVVYCDLDDHDCVVYEVAPDFNTFVRNIRTLE